MPRRALPEHSQQKCGEERCIYKAEYQLERVHDVVKGNSGVGRANGKQNAADRGPSAYREVMPVAGALVDVRLVEIVGEHGVEGGDIARHAAHKACQQRCQAKAKDAGWEEMQEHVGSGHVVIEERLTAGGQHCFTCHRIDLGRNQPAPFFHVVRHHRGIAHDHAVDVAFHCCCMRCRQTDGKKAGQNYEEREEDFWNGGNQRHASRSRHVVRGHGRLDDEKIGAPIARSQHEPKPHAQADDLDAHRICRSMRHAVPLMHVRRRNGCLQTGPTADVPQSQQHKGKETSDDQEELQNLVVDCACQSAEENVCEHNYRGKHNRKCEDSLRRPTHGVEEPIEHMQCLDEPRHRIH